VSRAEDSARDQRERALQSWELFIGECPDNKRLEKLRRIVRVKRFELDSLRQRLPGVVRRGARVDLEPLAEQVRALGIACELRERSTGGSKP